MNKILNLFVFLFFLLFSFTVESADFSVDFKEDCLSVVFVNTPVRTALQHIADQTGVTVYLDPDVKGTLSSRFNSIPLERALRRLLRSQSHAIFFSTDADKHLRVESLKVFRRGNQKFANYEILKGKEEEGKEKVESLVGTALDGNHSQSASNPFAPGAKAQIMMAISKSEKKLAYLHRKSRGEEQGMRREQTKAHYAAKPGEPPDYSPGRPPWHRRSHGLPNWVMEEEKKLKDLYKALANYKSPIQQEAEISDRVEEQLSAQASRDNYENRHRQDRH